MIHRNPYAAIRSLCIESVRDAIQEVYSIGLADVYLETPPNLELGEFAYPCFDLAKKVGKKPREVAQELTEYVSKTRIKGVQTVEVAGAGYLNFKLDYEHLGETTLEAVRKLAEDYGSDPIKPIKTLVEHTSANPIHAIHIGQARNALLGDVLSRILKKRGHPVRRHFYIDDMGFQVAIATFGYQKMAMTRPPGKPDIWLGKVYTATNCLLEINRLKKEIEESRSDPEQDAKSRLLIKELDDWVSVASELQDKESEIFEKLTDAIKSVEDPLDKIARADRAYEDAQPGAVRPRRKMCELALKGFRETFKRVGIEIDSWDWEGEITVWSGRVDKIVETLEKTPFSFHEGNSHAVDVNQAANTLKIRQDLQIPEGYELAPLTLTRSDGRTLYPTRDVAYTLWQFEHADRVVHVIATEQVLAVIQVKIALWLLGKKNLAKNFIHFDYDLVNLPGFTISSRRGRYVRFDDLIEESVKRARQEVQKRSPHLPEAKKKQIAEAVGIGALKYAFTAISPHKPITFNWEQVLNFERNSGPYIQYSHARAANILAKARKKPTKADGTLLSQPQEKRLIYHIARFPEVVNLAADSHRPELVADFANKLADDFNVFYDTLPVLKAKSTKLRNSRLGLVQAVKTTLSNALDLLGIAAPSRM
jgi:arginyl-tRNA synthetase